MENKTNVFVFGAKESTKSVKPNCTVNLKEQIYALQWSPYDWCQDLICIAFKNDITIATCKINNESDQLEFTKIHEFHHKSLVHCLAWSPQTSLAVVPNCVSFCAGGSDFNLHIFESDLSENHDCKILTGHSDYINEIAYEPDNRWLASVSDDHTCRLWSIDDNFYCDVVFQLTSPGVSVNWHTEDTGKLLVAEKVGIIRLYNANTQLAILSLEAMDSLASAHWCPTDPLKVTGSTGLKLLFWDLTKPSQCIESNSVHAERGGLVKFNQTGELVASLNLVGGCLKVSHVVTKSLLLSANIKLPAGLSWHQRLPIVTCADDSKLYFWKLLAK